MPLRSVSLTTPSTANIRTRKIAGVFISRDATHVDHKFQNASKCLGKRRGRKQMELLLSKSQEKGMLGMGAISFILDVKTRLTPEESELVKRYKMGDILIYEKLPVSDIAKVTGGLASGLLAVASKVLKLQFKVLKLQFKVSDLVNGRTVKCKDIGEMISAHEQIESAADNFYNLLMAAKNFEGEEVITYPRP